MIGTVPPAGVHGWDADRSAVPTHLMEEVVDHGELPASRTVSYTCLPTARSSTPRPNGGEDDRAVPVRAHPAGQHVVEGAVEEVPVAHALFGQVDGGVRLQTVLHVVDDVGGREDHLRRRGGGRAAATRAAPAGGARTRRGR